MRLIDADKIIFREIDEIGGEYEPYLGCSKSQIDSLPSVTPQEPILDKLRAEIERQEKWLMDAGYNQYNVDIALDAIKSVVDKYKAETEAEDGNVGR